MRPAVCSGASGNQGHRHTDLGRLRVRVGKEGRGWAAAGSGRQQRQAAAAAAAGAQSLQQWDPACEFMHSSHPAAAVWPPGEGGKGCSAASSPAAQAFALAVVSVRRWRFILVAPQLLQRRKVPVRGHKGVRLLLRAPQPCAGDDD